MRHLAAAEADRDLDTVAVGNEFLGVFELGVKIAHVDTGGHAHFLDLDDMLVLSGFLLTLALLEFVLAVVHQLAHGGRCLRRDLHQIKALLLCGTQRLLAGHDAQLLAIILADTPVDACLGDLMKLEATTADYLQQSVPGFDMEAPHYWANNVLADGVTAADLTVSEPALIGWLHTLEAISQLCMASARYRAAANYARRVLKAEGYPTRAAGTVLLALARLEDQDGFFALAHQLEEQMGADALENSPWYLLARTILLFKTNKMRPATRALREFANRCEGGAFFLLNPMYQTPYLPCRPEPRDPWDLSHQAVWEADGIISDTPDFAPWANACEDVSQLAQEFARRYGF